MKHWRFPVTIALSAMAALVNAQEIVTLKVALVSLTDDPQLRVDFEDGLAAKAREHRYDAVASYPFVPDIADVDDRSFLNRLIDEGIGVVLMMRPAAIGAGSTLDSVRDAVSPDIYDNIRQFAGEVSPSAGDNLFAVIHLGIYLVTPDGAEPLSAGAVWLDEEAETQEQSIELLLDLVLTNVNAVRGPIREHLGLPPLP